MKHRFEGKTGIYARIFMASLLIAALATGLWWGSRTENRRLQKQGWQYRYLQLLQPEMTRQADSLYTGSPDSFCRMVEQMEAEERAIEQAEAIARKKETEARRAKEKVQRLRKRK